MSSNWRSSSFHSTRTEAAKHFKNRNRFQFPDRCPSIRFTFQLTRVTFTPITHGRAKDTDKCGGTFCYLLQTVFVPRSLEALIPVWRHVGPELPQAVQLLQLPGGGLPGEEHAGVQGTSEPPHRQQAQQAKHPVQDHNSRTRSQLLTGELMLPVTWLTASADSFGAAFNAIGNLSTGSGLLDSWSRNNVQEIKQKWRIFYI